MFFSDVSLAARYFFAGHTGWTVATLVLVIVPAIVVSIFSLHWRIIDQEKLSFWHWLSHLTLWPIFQRYGGRLFSITRNYEKTYFLEFMNK